MRLMSLLPGRLICWIGRRTPGDPNQFGWNFWTDASYWKWCRRDARRELPRHVRFAGFFGLFCWVGFIVTFIYHGRGVVVGVTIGSLGVLHSLYFWPNRRWYKEE